MLLAGTVALALLGATPALPPPPASCAAAVVVGDPLEAGNDLHLGPGDDHFRPGVPRASAETFVFGDAGADCLEGTRAYDLLDGGAGADSLDGADGPDELVGGAGDDTLRTGSVAPAGGERADAGAGDDVVAPGPGATRVSLGAGDDTVVGTDGSAGLIACGPGEDAVEADALDVLTDCEEVTRRPAPTVRVKREAGGATLRFRSPWAKRGGLLGWSATLVRPAGARCGGLAQDTGTNGREVVLRLRPGRMLRPCAGRWTARIDATFAHDPQDECDGAGCGIATAPVTARVPFTLR